MAHAVKSSLFSLCFSLAGKAGLFASFIITAPELSARKTA
ncbi:hypothetical protein ABH13_0188 [Bacillus velezensis]|uniref:Uncharacterized protein n=1 Tax=Bacillus amyloliquefaciens (strain Y2) TaxID=1155777 RepID=I2C0U7_BACAY|nr:hypothetical protein MUS_0189 [Bacillus velezensis YAU B9601-Y2]AGZ54897.1 hypothetical protein U471_01810 [Bacillus amyloliquefaciens CC178]AKL74799.1 hypothetical protein ABH13_0188 [Bacillus velezensis]ANF35087.1 hypothetical protein BCBMB205_01800 [Bacillus velezensis]ARZ56500.1 hypothetical protein BAGQ_0231 [Bacillus velezensis]